MLLIGDPSGVRGSSEKESFGMPGRGGHRRYDRSVYDRSVYDRFDSDPPVQGVFTVPGGAGFAMNDSSVNGTCQKLGRPGNGRPYQVIFIVPGREWSCERLQTCRPPGAGRRYATAAEPRED